MFGLNINDISDMKEWNGNCSVQLYDYAFARGALSKVLRRKILEKVMKFVELTGWLLMRLLEIEDGTVKCAFH